MNPVIESRIFGLLSIALAIFGFAAPYRWREMPEIIPDIALGLAALLATAAIWLALPERIRPRLMRPFSQPTRQFMKGAGIVGGFFVGMIIIVFGMQWLMYWAVSTGWFPVRVPLPEPPKQTTTTTSTPPAQPQQPPGRLTSTFDRMNYICDKPQKHGDDKAEIQQYLSVIAGAQGWTPKFTDIENGFRMEGELSRNPEVPTITTEIRRFHDQLFVTRIYALMGNLRNYTGTSIEPSSSDVKTRISIIEDWVRAAPGSCRLN
jgi:hypothetical protein